MCMRAPGYNIPMGGYNNAIKNNPIMNKVIRIFFRNAIILDSQY